MMIVSADNEVIRRVRCTVEGKADGLLVDFSFFLEKLPEVIREKIGIQNEVRDRGKVR